jgi:hypothetical protein
VALSFNRKIYGSRLDKSETGFWIDKFLQMGCTFGQDYLACGPNVRLQQMTAVCRPILLSDNSMSMNDGLSSCMATSPISDSSSHCSSSVKDGSYFFDSQLNHPKRTEESAPTALKLAAASFCSTANSDNPLGQLTPSCENENKGLGRLINLPVLHDGSSLLLPRRFPFHQ